jgi:hypothetical protein
MTFLDESTGALAGAGDARATDVLLRADRINGPAID